MFKKFNKRNEAKRKLSSCGLVLATMIMFTGSVFGNLGEINTVEAAEYRTMSASSSASSSSSGDTIYYYNTEENMPKEATYDNENFDLLNKVKKGDIIYEAAGGYGITGHIAIVEGIFNDKETQKKYVRIIEAINEEGVCRGILDDQRMKDKKATVLRIQDKYFKFKGKNKKSKIIKKALKFVKKQLGEEYNLDLSNDSISSKNKDWYCSKLVWAAYKNYKIDIAGKIKKKVKVLGVEKRITVPEPGITPREIFACTKLKKIVKYTEE